MPKDRSLVRASDIGFWAFCNRAWWLANVADAQHEKPEVLDRGDRAHAAHGRQVRRSLQLNQWAILLMAAGLILAGLALIGWVIWG